MSIGLTIGGWFAQAFLQTLADKASSYYLEQSDDPPHDLRQLSSSLKKARIALCCAERKRIANKLDDLAELAAELAEQLRSLVYDADDLLGDLHYKTLSRKIEGGEAVGRPTFSPSSLFSLVNDDIHDIECELREVGDRLGQIAKELQDLLKMLPVEREGKTPVERERKTETSSFLAVPKVFGREVEKETIVKLLLSGSGGASFSVLPIISAAGVGKTTLAQYVCDDRRVRDHFNLKMWVCASDSFDVQRVTKEMIEAATREMQANLRLDSLQVILQEKVMQQRFLLVLDDVREDDIDITEWQKLCGPLRQGCQGSMILVTACSQKVAHLMGTMESIHLQGLSDDDCWKILKSHAFGPKDLAVPSDLEAVGTSMAAKLKGSPSAAISLADQLKGKTGVGDWQRIMNKEMWECKPLLSSYQYLPGHLKQCFSFCSIFPKQYLFNQRELVGVWMAQGFIATKENTQMEAVGTIYLQDLIDKFFFEYTQQDHGQYIIPDLMHKLAHLVSKEECFMLQDKRHHGMPSTIRHLSVCGENIELNKLKGIDRNSKLRSLLIFTNIMPDLKLAIYHWSNQFKYIRLLNLRSYKIDMLPESIGNLKHLRYLDISWTGITKLPEMLCVLYNLQVLNIRGCSLESFPEGFTKLINLRYLDVEVNLISKITKIGMLTSLQELQQFQVLNKEGHGIDELKDLSQLQKRLHIKNLENIKSKKDACQAELVNKEYVDELFLEWSPSRNSFAFDTEVLEGLQPHPKLTQLEIRHYGGEKSPSWLHRNLLSRISKLRIENCPNLKEIPCLPPVLTELRLVDLGLDTLPRLWDEGSSGVGSSSHGSGSIKSSSLSKLHVERLPRLTSLEQWLLPLHLPVIKSIQIIDCEELLSVRPERFKSFVHLEDLNISNCPKLTSEEKLGLPLSIKRFMLDACGDLEKSLPTCLESLTSLTVVKLCRCQHIICIQERILRVLTSLESLCILDCPAILSLRGLQALTSLESLHISDCAAIISLWGLEALTSLKSLYISDCPRIVLRGGLEALTSLESLYISDCPRIVLWGGLEALTSLESLYISDCPRIVSLRGLEALTSLKNLTILKCDELSICDSVNGELMMLQELEIDQTTGVKLSFLRNLQLSSFALVISESAESVLFVGEEADWLQILRSVEKLWFKKCTNLQSLPTWLSSLTSLKKLWITDCPNINSPLDNALRTSLGDGLYVNNCGPILLGQTQRRKH